MRNLTTFTSDTETNIQFYMTEKTLTKDYVIESFTRAELNKIKKMVLGYGKFKQTANQIGIEEVTLRSVINRGYGRPETLEKIRKVL